MKRVLLLITTLAALGSCAHVISRDTVSVAVKDVPFRVVAADIEAYRGSVFIWGGFIAGTEVRGEETIIEVVQNPIDRYGYISDTDVSEGRFLVRVKGRLDPLIYEPGRLITVAGELVGSEKRVIDKTEVVYPLLEAREIHLWREEPEYPPYYYDYPYWYWNRYPPPPHWYRHYPYWDRYPYWW